MRFDVSQKEQISLFFKELPTHDAKFSKVEYLPSKKELCIWLMSLNNSYFLKLVFYQTRFLISTGFDLWGTNDTILALVLEDNFEILSSLAKQISSHNINMHDSLYFVFQSFSGNEIHIICEAVEVNLISQR